MLSVAAVETFFSAITFALTLLLVFKTNSCYARWWEARSKVGLLTSTAHDLARAVSQLGRHSFTLLFIVTPVAVSPDGTGNWLHYTRSGQAPKPTSQRHQSDAQGKAHGSASGSSAQDPCRRASDWRALLLPHSNAPSPAPCTSPLPTCL